MMDGIHVRGVNIGIQPRQLIFGCDDQTLVQAIEPQVKLFISLVADQQHRNILKIS